MNTYPPPNNIATGNSGDLSAAAETTLISAPGAGSRYRVSKFSVYSVAATAMRMDIRDGPSGTLIYELQVPSGSAASPYVRDIDFDPPLVLGDNKAVVVFAAGGAATYRLNCVAFREKFTV